LVSSPFGPDTPMPLEGPFVPHNLIPGQGRPVPLIKLQTAP
jgi:hypothetical protein